MNHCLSALIKRSEEVQAQFYSKLPPGFRLLPYGQDQAPDPDYCLLDADGNDIAYPVTATEAHPLAWRAAGKKCPTLEEDLAWVSIQAEIDARRTGGAG